MLTAHVPHMRNSNVEISTVASSGRPQLALGFPDSFVNTL